MVHPQERMGKAGETYRESEPPLHYQNLMAMRALI